MKPNWSHLRPRLKWSPRSFKSRAPVLPALWSGGAKFIDQASKWFVVIGLFTFLAALPRQDVAENWKRLYEATGRGGSGGRASALSSLNCHYEDLSHVDLSKARIPRVNLQGAKIVRASFSQAAIEDGRFSRANAYEAKFDGAYLVNAKFRAAWLQASDFRGANLLGADFTEACLDAADFTGLPGGVAITADQARRAIWTEQTRFPAEVHAALLALGSSPAASCKAARPTFSAELAAMEQRTFYGRGFFDRLWSCIIRSPAGSPS